MSLLSDAPTELAAHVEPHACSTASTRLWRYAQFRGWPTRGHGHPRAMTVYEQRQFDAYWSLRDDSIHNWHGRALADATALITGPGYLVLGPAGASFHETAQAAAEAAAGGVARIVVVPA